MFQWILTIFLFITILTFTVYLLLPEIMIHLLGIGCWKRLYSPGVCLTFDDGPDPRYTTLMLDILKKNNITACFFILGENAEKYPRLVKRIYDDGHKIGSHGYTHRHAWKMSPTTTWRLWNKSIEEIKKITGQEPQVIRPPWGGINFSLILWCLVKNKTIVSWSVSGKDWLLKNDSNKIIENISKKVTEGSIILLHDSGGEQGAPANTIACIEQLCHQIRVVNKLPIVELEFPKWSVFRRLSFRIWEKWEHLYVKLHNIQRIDDNSFFRVGLKHYRGPDLLNGQGEVLATNGDIIGEIHFDNIRFQLIGTHLHTLGLRALKQIRLSLPSLAKYICENPDFSQVKVCIGVTMINKGAKGLGFNVQEYPSNYGHVIAFFQRIILSIYHPLGRQRSTSTLGSKPKLVWISKQDLIEKYFSKENALI